MSRYFLLRCLCTDAIRRQFAAVLVLPGLAWRTGPRREFPRPASDIGDAVNGSIDVRFCIEGPYRENARHRGYRPGRSCGEREERNAGRCGSRCCNRHRASFPRPRDRCRLCSPKRSTDDGCHFFFYGRHPIARSPSTSLLASCISWAYTRSTPCSSSQSSSAHSAATPTMLRRAEFQPPGILLQVVGFDGANAGAADAEPGELSTCLRMHRPPMPMLPISALWPVKATTSMFISFM